MIKALYDNKGWFFMAGFFQSILGFLSGGGLSGAIDEVKHKVEETVEEMEERIRRVTVKVIKTSILFLMMFVGFIFLLVGLAQYLNAVVPKLANGLGTLLIGAVLILMALFARTFRN
jgi:hypothetical protein